MAHYARGPRLESLYSLPKQAIWSYSLTVQPEWPPTHPDLPDCVTMSTSENPKDIGGFAFVKFSCTKNNFFSEKKRLMSRINTVTTNEINGATHHVIIPQYPSGNQTGLFVASYCHPELGHSRPNLNKKRKNEQRLK